MSLKNLIIATIAFSVIALVAILINSMGLISEFSMKLIAGISGLIVIGFLLKAFLDLNGVLRRYHKKYPNDTKDWL